MVSKRMSSLRPYVAGEQPRDRRYIKLNTNENPYPPSPQVEKYLREIDVGRLRLYPDPRMTQLREAIAGRYDLGIENIFVGNGSDEVLSFCFYAFFDEVLFPELTYSFYPVYCDFYGIQFDRIPMRDDFGVDLEGFSGRDGGIIIANPNSPTGMYLQKAEISEFLQLNPRDSIVIVDEAYIEFGGATCADLVKIHKNLVIVHTFSKSHSLAGLRLGYALASPDLISMLFTVKDSFNSYPVHTIAQDVGLCAFLDGEYTTSIAQRIIEIREYATEELQRLGWVVSPSKANFLFAAHPKANGKEVYTKLKEQGILVRYFDINGLKKHVRITVGTREQMELLIETAMRLWG